MSGTGIAKVQKRNADYFLTVRLSATNDIYVNRYSGNQWKSWDKLPNRAEMFTEATAILSSNIGIVYTNSVWKIGSMCFYSMAFRVQTEIANNETVATLPYIAQYRHDSTFTKMNGEHIVDAYLSANSQTLKNNGAAFEAGTDVKVSGFYQIK